MYNLFIYCIFSILLIHIKYKFSSLMFTLDLLNHYFYTIFCHPLLHILYLCEHNFHCFCIIFYLNILNLLYQTRWRNYSVILLFWIWRLIAILYLFFLRSLLVFLTIFDSFQRKVDFIGLKLFYFLQIDSKTKIQISYLRI